MAASDDGGPYNGPSASASSGCELPISLGALDASGYCPNRQKGKLPFLHGKRQAQGPGELIFRPTELRRYSGKAAMMGPTAKVVPSHPKLIATISGTTFLPRIAAPRPEDPTEISVFTRTIPKLTI